eukprot:3968869-Alexandrium_andersonii.AAC.1
MAGGASGMPAPNKRVCHTRGLLRKLRCLPRRYWPCVDHSWLLGWAGRWHHVVFRDARARLRWGRRRRGRRG